MVFNPPCFTLIMKIIKLNKSNRLVIVKQAVDVLKQGGTVVYPTETAYGLGADFLNPEAIKKIYRIKGRNFKKPLSVIVADLKMAQKSVKFNKIALNLAKKYWPGALTLILNSKFSIPSKFKNSDYKTLALRVSADKLAGAIAKKLKNPLTATSANLSGKGELYSAKAVIKEFSAKVSQRRPAYGMGASRPAWLGPASGRKNKKFQPDLIIDAGKLAKVKPSTIVKISKNKIEILRQGNIVILEQNEVKR